MSKYDKKLEVFEQEVIAFRLKDAGSPLIKLANEYLAYAESMMKDGMWPLKMADWEEACKADKERYHQESVD